MAESTVANELCNISSRNNVIKPFYSSLHWNWIHLFDICIKLHESGKCCERYKYFGVIYAVDQSDRTDFRGDQN